MKTITLMMIATMTVMAGATIAPVLPAIKEAFGGTSHVTFLAQLLLSLTALFTAISAPVAGKLADQYGRRPIVLSAILIYGIAGSAGLYLESLWSLLISRALLGVAVGALMTVATTLVADYFSGAERTKMMGLKGGAASFGGVVFLSLGGVLAESGWRFPFLIYLSSFLVLPMAYFAITEPVKNKPEKTKAIEFSSLKKFVPIYGAALISMMFFYIIPTQVPFFLSEQYGEGGAFVGQMISLSAVIGGIIASNYQRLEKRLSKKTLIMISWGSMGLAHVIIGQSTNLYHIAISMVFLGTGYGLFMPSLNLMTADLADDSNKGVSLGLLTTSVFLGQFLAPFFSSLVQSLEVTNTFNVTGFLLLLTLMAYTLIKLVKQNSKKSLLPSLTGKTCHCH